MSDRFDTGRHAGALVPLFSIPSRGSWGIGEIPDVARFARWLSSAGLDVVQLLPVNEMADGQSSPYSALSAMATGFAKLRFMWMMPKKHILKH